MIVLLITIIGFRLNLKKKWQKKQEKVSKKYIELMVPLKYLSNFWRTLEMLLHNSEISPMLTWYKNWCLVAGTAAGQEPTFIVNDTKLNVPVVNLSTKTIETIVKLSKQLKSGFKRTFNWNKYQTKTTSGTKTIFSFFNWSKFSRSKWAFCFIWK